MTLNETVGLVNTGQRRKESRPKMAAFWIQLAVLLC